MKNPFEKMMGNSAEQERKYGLNVHAVLEFGRHEAPGKTPEGMSADYLTDEGKQNAAKRGNAIEEENVAAYASPKLRAQETVDLEMRAADLLSEGAVNVVNKRMEDMPGGLIKEGVQKEGNKFRVKVSEELDATADFGKIMPLAQAYAKEQVNAGSERSGYDLIVQFYLDNAELCEQEGIDTPHESATHIAYRAAREVGMTEKFLNDTDIRLVNITHGPKLEPFLLEVVDDFENMGDFGGALNPGESFNFEVNTDSNGNRNVKLNLREKSYDVNEEQLQLLATEYRDKIKAERG